MFAEVHLFLTMCEMVGAMWYANRAVPDARPGMLFECAGARGFCPRVCCQYRSFPKY